jgi:TolB-like protein
MSLFQELKRRNVFRVAIAYLITAWLLIQLTDILVPMLTLPDWVGRLVFLILVILFVPILIAAWALELTPEGIKLEKQVDRSASITPTTGKKINGITIGVLAIAVVVLLVDKLYLGDDVPVTEIAAVDKSIAVLPFADLSQGQDQEWFADGLAEEILNALARAPDLLVASRTSAFAYKHSDKDLRVIAAELGVAHILEGSVRRTADRLRVTAQLIRASDGFHLWSENYDRDADDIIDVQEDLALKIANAMQTTMDPAALKQMLSAGTQSVDAYQKYLRGLAVGSEGYRDGFAGNRIDSLALFEEARRIDPTFAAAHLQVARFWDDQSNPTNLAFGLTDKSLDEVEANYQASIDQAIANANNPVDRRALEAEKAMRELHLRRAEELFQSYLRDRPNSLDAWSGLVYTAWQLNDVAVVAKALEHVRNEGMTIVDAADNYMNFAYRFVDPSLAADYGLAALRRWPDYNSLMYQTHRTLMWARRPNEAADIARRYKELFGFDAMVEARQACMEGRGEDVRDVLDRVLSSENVPAFDAWTIYLMLEDPESAEGMLRPYEQNAPINVLANWLNYQQFDPTPFPKLMAVLRRESMQRRPPVPMPYTCPVASNAR